MPAFHFIIALTGGATLRCAPYASFGTPELSKVVLKAIEGRNACLLSNDGMICFDETLDAALALAVEVETLCHQYIIACKIGEPVLLDDAKMQVRFKAYGRSGAELGPVKIRPLPLLNAGIPKAHIVFSPFWREVRTSRIS